MAVPQRREIWCDSSHCKCKASFQDKCAVEGPMRGIPEHGSALGILNARRSEMLPSNDMPRLWAGTKNSAEALVDRHRHLFACLSGTP